MKTQDAIEFFGSVRRLANALDIAPQSVYKWGENVPPLRAYQLREVVEAKREELRRQKAVERAFNEWADEVAIAETRGEDV